MTNPMAVILGGTGMVGANMAQLLDRVGGWDVTIVSRRAPEFATRARHVACDMSDPDDCARVLGA
ncbi:MAG TPA: NAD-dependent epimerase/dehydratase family protein, partial [Rubrivivax sp.]|nr:NAD-dependent epimerase/dehydratase family protein [Rubrivivax sp.]